MEDEYKAALELLEHYIQRVEELEKQLEIKMEEKFDNSYNVFESNYTRYLHVLWGLENNLND